MFYFHFALTVVCVCVLVCNEVSKLNDLEEDADLHLFTGRTITSHTMLSGVRGKASKKGVQRVCVCLCMSVYILCGGRVNMRRSSYSLIDHGGLQSVS